MKEPALIDYTSMPPEEFWALVDKQADISKRRTEQLFHRAGTSEKLDYTNAIDCLNHLFVDSHRRLRELYPSLVNGFPTKHVLLNSVQSTDDLWVVDHTTSNISNSSMLNWFGHHECPIGFSTHFLIGYSGLPFHLVPLMHGAVHEPHKDVDSISISTLNAGPLFKDKGKWKFWGGFLPQNMVVDLPPVRLAVPYKGNSVLQPFTTEQIKNNIIIKRIILAALRGKIDHSRFTQHSDWNTTSIDMGPLWPTEQVNDSTFENIPVAEHDFVQRYDSTISDASVQEAEKNPVFNSQNPEYKFVQANALPSMSVIQLALCNAGLKVKVDNRFNVETKVALQKFQILWNREHVDDPLDTKGIPNINTCKRLCKGV